LGERKGAKKAKMKNLEKANPFKSTVAKTDFGTATTLLADFGVSQHGSINYKGKTLLANYVYAENETYKLVYTVFDNDGNHESFAEDDGILPTLFLSPENEAFVSVQPYDPDNDLEISIPVFNRENTELPKRNRPFLGKFMGTAKQFSILYDGDIWSETKPDKLLAIEFKDGAIKKKHNVKVPLPRNNKVFIADNEIHLLAIDGKSWLHRQIDEKGNVIRERKIQPGTKYFSEILSLSFEKESYILCGVKGKISLEIISTDGKSKSKELADIKCGFYNTWKPAKIAEGTYVTQFNGDLGNGWFTIKNDQLLELFYGKEVKGYKNLFTNEILKMNNEHLCVSNINKTTENAYAVVFYPMTERGLKNKELIILNREIKPQ
jgi:hypothetical protein